MKNIKYITFLIILLINITYLKANDELFNDSISATSENITSSNSGAIGDPIIGGNNSNGKEENKTIQKNTEFDVLDLELLESNNQIYIIGKLKANSTTFIKSADITLNYDSSAFDISLSDISAGGDNSPLPLQSPNSSMEIVNGKITFSLTTDIPFNNKLDGAELFMATFSKSKNFDPNKTYNFNVDNKTTFIKSPDGIQLLSSEGASVSYGNKEETVKPIETNNINETVETKAINTENKPKPLPKPTQIDLDEASKTKTGVFENIIIAISFFILGIAIIRKRKSYN